MVGDGVDADCYWDSRDVCRARGIAGGVYLSDRSVEVASYGVSRGGHAGGTVVGASVLLGEPSGEEVVELDTWGGVCDCSGAAFAVSGVAEALGPLSSPF